MDSEFWHQRWIENKIGFHLKDVNPIVIKYFDELKLKKGSRVFIPLCGKTNDIAWLLSKGFHVVGVELSSIAINQLFKDLDMVPKITLLADFVLYQAQNLDIFVGDIFSLNKKLLGNVHAIYDRAALVALPPELRNRYTVHLIEITKNIKQLLVCFEYDQSKMEGPPFSITSSEVTKQYSQHYAIKQLVSTDIPDGLRGNIQAKETVWLLS